TQQAITFSNYFEWLREKARSGNARLPDAAPACPLPIFRQTGRRRMRMDPTAADLATLWQARFGTEPGAVELPAALAALLDRRVTRRYRAEPVSDALLDGLLAVAQSAPSKSDLQQYSVVVMRDPARIKRIADWIGTMPWIASAPVFLVWCADMRRGVRLCDMHGMPHANNNLDTFLNGAVDCTLAMG